MNQWLLKTKNHFIPWIKDRQFGRDDFDNDKSISRQHFELRENENQIFLTDLGSSNGTYIESKRLSANESYPLSEGEVFRIGSIEFSVERMKWHEFGFSNLKFDSLIFGVLFILIFAQGGNRFGLVFGLKGFLIVFLLLIFAFIVSAFLFRIIYFLKVKGRQKKFYVTYFVSVLVGGLMFHHLLLTYTTHKFGLMSLVVTSKIEYYCLENFDHGNCVMNVNLCPKCAISIHKWKRDKMVENLKKHRSTYPKSLQNLLNDKKSMSDK